MMKKILSIHVELYTKDSRVNMAEQGQKLHSQNVVNTKHHHHQAMLTAQSSLSLSHHLSL